MPSITHRSYFLISRLNMFLQSLALLLTRCEFGFQIIIFNESIPNILCYSL